MTNRVLRQTKSPDFNEVMRLSGVGKIMKCPVCREECEAGTDCISCKIYFCPNCKEWKPWEMGCHHDIPEADILCDNCFCKPTKYFKIHTSKEEQRHTAFLAYWWRKMQFEPWNNSNNPLLSAFEEQEELIARDKKKKIDRRLKKALMKDGKMPQPVFAW